MVVGVWEGGREMCGWREGGGKSPKPETDPHCGSRGKEESRTLSLT